MEIIILHFLRFNTDDIVHLPANQIADICWVADGCSFQHIEQNNFLNDSNGVLILL